MGTRNLTIVTVNATRTKSDERRNTHIVAQYGQWDGYPSGGGAQIFDVLHEVLSEGRLDEFRDKCLNTRFVSDEYVQGLWKSLGADDSGMVPIAMSREFAKKWPALHRDIGPGVLGLILDSKDTVALIDSYEFAADSLFCEWCYVVDLDAECLEVYTGFNERPLDPGERFANLPVPSPGTGSRTYYPVRLLHTFSFDEIAALSLDEFVQTLNEAANRRKESGENRRKESGESLSAPHQPLPGEGTDNSGD